MQVDGNFVVASIGVPSQTIYTNEDVVFNAIATNANQYQWSFGDSTLIVGVANPDQTYLVPGQYTVNLICSNALGCTATAQANVIVYLPAAINNVSSSAINVSANQKDVTVKMSDVPSLGAKINIYNLLGQLLLAKPITQQTEVFTLADQPTGYYLVSVENNDEVRTKKILLAQ